MQEFVASKLSRLYLHDISALQCSSSFLSLPSSLLSARQKACQAGKEVGVTTQRCISGVRHLLAGLLQLSCDQHLVQHEVRLQQGQHTSALCSAPCWPRSTAHGRESCDPLCHTGILCRMLPDVSLPRTTDWAPSCKLNRAAKQNPFCKAGSGAKNRLSACNTPCGS